jgi:hypothetical protein
MTLWEEHLLPLLTCKDAARLGCTCKALRGLVREHFRELGTIKVKQLQHALTTFPRAREMAFGKCLEPWDDKDKEALLQWLHWGGRGRHIEGMMLESRFSRVEDFVHLALQQGALPSLKRLDARLDDETHRTSLTRGFSRGVHELRVIFDCGESCEGVRYKVEPQLAALSLVRQLPALTRLELKVNGYDGVPVPRWPPFIPPSLKALRIDLSSCNRPTALEPLLRAFPVMLEVFGARLERLEVLIPTEFKAIGDGLVHLAQALRYCSPTLKDLLLSTGAPENLNVDEDFARVDRATRVERLRVQWADVLAGVSACRELQVLVLPRIEVESLFPPGTAFARLTHLEMCDYEREHPPDAGMMGPWELMASGGLPALAKLNVRLEGRTSWGDKEMRDRVAPGLEALVGTLRHLELHMCYGGPENGSDEVRVGTSWGWRWASCGGSGTSPLSCPMMAASITPSPKAWPPVGGSALFPCCGGWGRSR